MALHLGRRSEAVRDVHRARLVVVERPPTAFPWLAAQAAIAVGELLLDLDDPAGARNLAAHARQHLSRLLTAGVLGDRLHALETRLDRGDADDAGLSPAERRVLELLPTHLSLGDIAESLSLSRNTVKSHVGAIHRKLGASTRTQAVERARERGLIGPATP